jgi:predicted ribosome quality control (RQC) complex YloA/Tae2 family protein
MTKPYDKPIRCTRCGKAVGVAHLVGDCTYETKREVICKPCYDSLNAKYEEACEYSKQLTIARRKVESEKRELQNEARKLHDKIAEANTAHEEYVRKYPDVSEYVGKIASLEKTVKDHKAAITIANKRTRIAEDRVSKVRSILGEET